MAGRLWDSLELMVGACLLIPKVKLMAGRLWAVGFLGVDGRRLLTDTKSETYGGSAVGCGIPWS